ncbi:MAG: type I restriction-modification system subunit M [Treponemataceae bacterium]|nr:type I restriction-modification system subunit M [Treponemataceae bacterium]
MSNNTISDTMWDDNPIDITQEANFIWSIANKLRGSYMPDHYGDVIIPMTILRRFECALEEKKRKVVDAFKADSALPYKKLCKISGFQFYNTSEYTLAELCNDSKRIAANFKNYLEGFSPNVYEIFSDLEMSKHIDKMDKDGCLYTVVEAFATLDLSIQTYDSIKMGYIFENLIGRFFQNVDAGQFYTGRDIIKLLVEILLAEGCDDIFDSHKVITVLDQACGTGGMLSTAYSYIMHYNPTAEVRLFGQEFMGQTYAIGLAEMLIKNQDADNFRHIDTFKEDCFPDTKMRFVIENGSPLFNGDTASGESQIRRWLLERDLIEAIIALPTDLFYNTGIQTYVWILSKNKRNERRGKIQLINAADIYHKLRKAVGNKKNEITKEDRKAITHLYADFVPTENCKIFDNTEFLYREYAVMQPLQRNYAITEERIEQMLAKGTLSSLYDEAKVAEFESKGIAIEEKDRRKYEAMLNNKPLYESLLRTLKANVSDKLYKEPKGFVERLSAILPADKKLIEKIAAGLSEMDKTAAIQRDKNGDILYDKETYDKEIVKYAENIEDYMAREVLPYVPDAQWFWEENLGAKKPVIKVGAEIPFTRYFYTYSQPQPSAELAAKFMELEASVSERIKGLFGEK